MAYIKHPVKECAVIKIELTRIKNYLKLGPSTAGITQLKLRLSKLEDGVNLAETEVFESE